MRLLSVLFCLLLACAVLSGCKPEEAQGPAALTVPLTDQDDEWNVFIKEVAKSKRIKGKTKGIYVRFLGTTEDPSLHLKDTISIFQRGVEQGSLFVFGSYNSRNMADLLVSAFSAENIDGKLNGSRLLFIGRREDETRVRATTAKSGVGFEFFPVD